MFVRLTCTEFRGNARAKKIRVMESKEVHISSMVVHASPEGLQTVKESIASLPGTEIHAESDQGKLVVVLESDNQSHITEVIDQISGFKHVLNTALVYHQIEPMDPSEIEHS